MAPALGSRSASVLIRWWFFLLLLEGVDRWRGGRGGEKQGNYKERSQGAVN